MNINKPVEDFLKNEASSAIVLGTTTALAIALANSPLSANYFQLFRLEFFGIDIRHWINDGLMTIFFFVIAMEIKRELVSGELKSTRSAALPVSAALGGMILPAIIYLGMNPVGAVSKGWVIPISTDIAFAVGVFALLGKRGPLSLKHFLLAIAIIGNLGAVFIVATFYVEEIRSFGLLIAGSGVISIIISRRFGVKSYFWYLPSGIVIWLGMFYSGIHATVAGIAIGFLTPDTFRSEKKSLIAFSPLDRLIHILHPWVCFGIIPIFALANAGIPIDGIKLNGILENSVFLGMVVSTLVGKPVGIILASRVSVALDIAFMPRELNWKHLSGAAILSGTGYTMGIFVANLSIPTEFAIEAKIAILATSIFSASIGYFLLTKTLNDGQ